MFCVACWGLIWYSVFILFNSGDDSGFVDAGGCWWMMVLKQVQHDKGQDINTRGWFGMTKGRLLLQWGCSA